MFFTDGAFTPRREPSDRREELQERIRQLRMMKWADPGDRRELEGLIEEAERELRQLDGRG
jgi:hypothetical protein